MEDVAVRCKNISKQYPIYTGDFERLKGLVLPHYKPKFFTALDGIDLELYKGEVLGIIGLNGSGKSTLSSIIAGITHASSGELSVRGEVSMLSVGAGIDSLLTGRENISFKCMLLGMSPAHIKEIEPAIIEFADIGIHIDLPVRTYSSGMKSRLGFAISTHLNPDILIIDEALSVGDNSFADKSLAKMMEFKEKGKTIVFVSHGVAQMNVFCDRVLWLHKGKILGCEKPERMIRPYCEFAREFIAMTKNERERFVPSLEAYQEKFL